MRPYPDRSGPSIPGGLGIRDPSAGSVCTERLWVEASRTQQQPKRRKQRWSQDPSSFEKTIPVRYYSVSLWVRRFRSLDRSPRNCLLYWSCGSSTHPSHQSRVRLTHLTRPLRPCPSERVQGRPGSKQFGFEGSRAVTGAFAWYIRFRQSHAITRYFQQRSSDPIGP